MAVVILRWPDEEREVKRLSGQGVAYLMLVAPDSPPPERDDELGDWIRLPADHQDVLARIAALEKRASRLPSRPELDNNRRVSYRGRWVILSPIEHNMMAVLVERYGDLVSAAELAERGWPTGQARASDNAMRVHLTRLRQRIAALGLEVANVKGHGFVLGEASDQELPIRGRAESPARAKSSRRTAAPSAVRRSKT